MFPNRVRNKDPVFFISAGRTPYVSKGGFLFAQISVTCYGKTTFFEEDVMTVVAESGKFTPKQTIIETIGALAGLQDLATRGLGVERSVAEEANQYVHRGDTQDFMIVVGVLAGARFWSRYLPKADLERREDWMKIGLKMCNGSVDELFRLHDHGSGLVRSYFDGFALGTDLGWGTEMAEKWYMHFSDETGSYYVPVDAVAEVMGAGF
jgi:hypothetical protein